MKGSTQFNKVTNDNIETVLYSIKSDKGAEYYIEFSGSLYNLKRLLLAINANPHVVDVNIALKDMRHTYECKKVILLFWEHSKHLYNLDYNGDISTRKIPDINEPKRLKPHHFRWLRRLGEFTEAHEEMLNRKTYTFTQNEKTPNDIQIEIFKRVDVETKLTILDFIYNKIQPDNYRTLRFEYERMHPDFSALKGGVILFGAVMSFLLASTAIGTITYLAISTAMLSKFFETFEPQIDKFIIDYNIIDKKTYEIV